MALLNLISLHMFQIKMKIYPTVIPVIFAKHLQVLNKCTLSALINASVETIHMTRAVMERMKGIMPKSIYLNGINI